MRVPRFVTMLVVLLAVLAACGGDDAADTTAGPDTSAVGSDDGTDTTQGSAATTTAADGDGGEPSVGIDAMPQECIDAFGDFLRAIEPVVADLDVDTATSNDLNDLQAELDPISAEFEASTEDLDCPDLTEDEDVFAAMIEIAEREAPGTVAYLTLAQSVMSAIGDAGGNVSGDCETDLAAIQAFVDQGGTMNDLPMTDFAQVLSLLTTVQEVCTVERVTEFFGQDDVIAFTSDSG
ncbi:MAG: hypothetical protein M3349_04315 [Actinomycetota bacterium]|nr:hypothetical protein [Actinomycetota bacterium]